MFNSFKVGGDVIAFPIEILFLLTLCLIYCKTECIGDTCQCFKTNQQTLDCSNTIVCDTQESINITTECKKFNITTLDLSGRNLSHIPDIQCPNLTMLILRYNRINASAFFENNNKSLHSFPKLSVIDLSYNTNISLNQYNFECFPKQLKVVILYSNDSIDNANLTTNDYQQENSTIIVLNKSIKYFKFMRSKSKNDKNNNQSLSDFVPRISNKNNNGVTFPQQHTTSSPNILSSKNRDNEIPIYDPPPPPIQKGSSSVHHYVIETLLILVIVVGVYYYFKHIKVRSDFWRSRLASRSVATMYYHNNDASRQWLSLSLDYVSSRDCQTSQLNSALRRYHTI